MWKRILTISLLLVMVLSFTACAKQPSAQEIVDGVIESFDNIRTYQFDTNITMDVAGEVEGEALEQTVTVDTSSTLDLENIQMSTDLTMNVDTVAPEEDEVEMGAEIYIIDGMMYTMPEAPGDEPKWTKQELPAEVWEVMKGMSSLVDYKELLKTAQVDVIGSEKVKGADCYVLQLTPDIVQLCQIIMNPVGGGGTGGILSSIPEEFLQEITRSFSVKQWIARDTYFLMKVEIDIAMESTPELMEYLGEEGEMTIDLTMSLLVYNYNQPVSIILPPEAEEAIVVPTPAPAPTPPPVPELLPPPVPPETVIDFPDKNLAAAIRDVLSTPMGDNITAAELATLTMLNASKYGISDITGIEYCVNLGNLGLDGNQINDISPLSHLTSLTWLHLAENQISNIFSLQNLTGLRGLTLGDNQISDISPLSSLVNLTNIYIWGNKISDITPLSSLTNLNQLNLYGNQISDISPLSNLTSLTWLNLDNNEISDISPLSNLTGLTWLSLENNKISDISPLSNLTSLTGLRLHENQISNIIPLQNLTNLTDLWLLDNQISDISPLENLTRLYSLSLEKNEISDISPLSNLANLTELWLWDNQISDISPLASLTNLNRVGLWSNQIGDITPLSNLTSLTWLSLEHNEISDISPLSNLTSLTELYFQDNQISDISSLSNLTRLTELHLQDNQISDISPLSKLTSLTWLRLHENQISDISLLVENSGLGAGDEVSLEDNELDLTEGSEDMENIRALEDRGVIVHYE